MYLTIIHPLYVLQNENTKDKKSVTVRVGTDK